MGAVFIAMAGIGMMPGSAGAAVADPQSVVQTYLTSLKNGDVTTLADLLGGRLKDRNERLLTKNPGYPDFLRTHYAGVVMTIIDITPSGDDYQIQVRFDNPTSESNTHTFKLSLIDGQWKIVNEQLF